MEIIVKLDKKGRIVVPKEFRRKLNLREGVSLKLSLEGSKIIIEPMPKVKKVKAKALKEVYFDAGKITFGE